MCIAIQVQLQLSVYCFINFLIICNENNENTVVLLTSIVYVAKARPRVRLYAMTDACDCFWATYSFYGFLDIRLSFSL